MIGRRTLVELLHVAGGLVGAAAIASLAIWSLPHAAPTIWGVAYGAMAIVLFMGIRPLRMAWRADRERAGDRRADR